MKVCVPKVSDGAKRPCKLVPHVRLSVVSVTRLFAFPPDFLYLAMTHSVTDQGLAFSSSWPSMGGAPAAGKDVVGMRAAQ